MKVHPEKALSVLSPLISEARRRKITSVISSRTRSVSVLLENVHDSGNVNAVLRSMDAFGVLTLHRLTSVPPTKRQKPTVRTDAGTRQWIEIQNWNNLTDCIKTLKDDGFKIACTCPKSSLDITEIDFCQKTVIAFGNERDGISESLAGLSDVKFSLPMCGFVESFNISVSVAITLCHAYSQRMRALVSLLVCVCASIGNHIFHVANNITYVLTLVPSQELYSLVISVYMMLLWHL